MKKLYVALIIAGFNASRSLHADTINFDNQTATDITIIGKNAKKPVFLKNKQNANVNIKNEFELQTPHKKYQVSLPKKLESTDYKPSLTDVGSITLNNKNGTITAIASTKQGTKEDYFDFIVKEVK